MQVKSFYAHAVQRFQSLRRKRIFRYGLPFLLFLFVGSFGIEQFASLRYEFRKNETLKPENLAKLGIKKKTVTLEEEYEKLKKLDLDSWENIRGPRPWEEPQQMPPKKKQ
ncbi:cytochrome c oxidase assembly protein COX16 homolog, mitochondrial-like [Stegodyphus dumicola]|uniref:cytochrome c oxidase assembly protein COX16 homolog, mitochondrial-like n=1 Tax=Stegodyphus dumicola TaxID=202533 RepID=UPI0015ACB2F3|nr:cytochrome c oxidase assembly protein COX16 homolog, mitochondrial-like [Stegodyphus dumicola]